MQAERQHRDVPAFVARPQLTGGLRFDNVRFAYPGQEGHALDDISCSIDPGERVAIVGPVGSGKSTIARLTFGLFTPDVGEIFADGVDIRQIDPADLRASFGVVLQDNWLLPGTLRENIAFGDPPVTDNDLLRAAQIAGVEAFARRYRKVYDMPVDEGGGLFGGRRR